MEHPISPWHDLPLRPKVEEGESQELDVFTGVIEIERQSTAKMEVETTMKYNPIVQDKLKDKTTGREVPRHYGVPALFNYGMIP